MTSHLSSALGSDKPFDRWEAAIIGKEVLTFDLQMGGHAHHGELEALRLSADQSSVKAAATIEPPLHAAYAPTAPGDLGPIEQARAARPSPALEQLAHPGQGQAPLAVPPIQHQAAAADVPDVAPASVADSMAASGWPDSAQPDQIHQAAPAGGQHPLPHREPQTLVKPAPHAVWEELPDQVDSGHGPVAENAEAIVGRTALLARPSPEHDAEPVSQVSAHPSMPAAHAPQPLPAPRRRVSWTKVALGASAAMLLAAAGLAWLGAKWAREAEEARALKAEEALPTFEQPISAVPTVAPVTEHRADQLGEVTDSASEPVADAVVPAVVLDEAASSVPQVPGLPASAAAGGDQRRSSIRYLKALPAAPVAGPGGPSKAQRSDMIALKDKPAKATGRSTPEAPTRAEPVQPPDPISAKPIDPVPVDPNAVREVVYGASGIVAITPSSVVVFDRETRKQKEVRVGGVLPDGSTLTGIQANRHRLQTSRGIMALKAPGGDSN